MLTAMSKYSGIHTGLLGFVGANKTACLQFANDVRFSMTCLIFIFLSSVLSCHSSFIFKHMYSKLASNSWT